MWCQIVSIINFSVDNFAQLLRSADLLLPNAQTIDGEVAVAFRNTFASWLDELQLSKPLSCCQDGA